MWRRVWLVRLLLQGLLSYISGVLSDVTLFVPLDFGVVPEDTAVIAGQQAVLSCSAAYNNSPPDVYSWERNSALLHSFQNSRYILNNGSIVFSSVQEGGPSADPGRYRCIAEVITQGIVYRVATPEAKLELARMGDFTVQPASLRVAAGDSAMMECRTSAFPAPTYSWTKNGIKLGSTANLLIHGNGEALEILVASSADSGSYQCHSESLAGSIQSQTATLSLTPSADSGVAEALEFVVRPRDVSAKLGSSVSLYCAIRGRGGDGKQPAVTWLRQGSTVDIERSDDHYELIGRGSLRISNITERDIGRYTCRGANSIGIADSELSLTGLTAPYFATRPSHTYGRVNGDVELKCDIKGYPQPRVHWLKNSDYLSSNQYFKMVRGSLRIMGLMPTDAGYYQCIGENSVGKVLATAQLIVLEEGESVSPELETAITDDDTSGPPEPPGDPQTVLVSQNYVSLTWKSSETPARHVLGYIVSATPLSVQSVTARIRSANTTSTNYAMQALQPNTEYKFTVAAYNRHARSPSKELTVRTTAAAAVPGPVRDIRAIPLNSSSIHVSWSIPLEIHDGVLEYKVFFYFTDQFEESNISTTSNSVEIGGLLPYTEYHIRVAAYNVNGQGVPSDDVTAQTFSAKPNLPPINVSAHATGHDSILVSWSPPPSTSINGQLTGYQIKYKAKFGRPSTFTTDADARSYEVDGLEPSTLYMLRVGAVNINGTGNYTDWVEAVTYVTQLDETRPPGKPLTLHAEALAREILVTWVPANDSVLILGYKLGYGTIVPDAYWLDIEPTAIVAYLSDLEPKTNYVLKLFAYNNAGNGEPREQQIYTKTDASRIEPPKELLPPLGVQTMVWSTSAFVTWHDSTLGARQQNMDGRVYTVRYSLASSTSQRRTRYVNSSNLEQTLEGLRPYTGYEFSVMVTKGSRASTYSFSVTNRTLEAAPSTAPEDLIIRLADGMSPNWLDMSWRPPSQPNGRITQYKIFSNTDRSIPLDRWAEDGVAGGTLSHRFGPVTPDTVYYFTIAAFTRKGMSPRTTVVTVRTPDADGNSGSGFYGGHVTVSTSRAPTQNVITMAFVPKLVSEDDGLVLQLPDSNISLLQKSPYILWIIIAGVAAVAVIAITIFLVIICGRRKKSGGTDPQAKPTSQAPDVVVRPSPPDLWIDHHERHQLNRLRGRDSETDNDTDEMTSMLQSNFDVSVSMAGDVQYHRDDEGRFSSMTRSGRPVIIASTPHREGMPRAAVPPMTVDPSRPLYPKTQFAAGGQLGGQLGGNMPRVHVGDTSQPSSVKPLPVSGFKMTNQMTGSTYQPGNPGHQIERPHGANCCASPSASHRPMLQRTPSSQSPNPAMNNLSASREDLKSSMMTHSTEQLSAEMANLDCIMQDLNAIKNDFEMV